MVFWDNVIILYKKTVLKSGVDPERAVERDV